MGRSKPQGSVIPRKEFKVTKIFESMENKQDFQEFKQRFMELYPKDWDRIEKRFKWHERHNVGKPHPMPDPETYRLNLFNHFYKKLYQTANPDS